MTRTELFRGVIVWCSENITFTVRRRRALAGVLLALACVVQAALGADPAFLKIRVNSPQHSGMPFEVNVQAYTSDGSALTTLNGPLTLTATGPDGAVPLVAGEGLALTNGGWSGSVSIQTNGLAIHIDGSAGVDCNGSSDALNVLPFEMRETLLSALDIVYDPTRHSVWASVGNGDSLYSNSIVRINPDTGQIEASVPVGEMKAPSVLVYYTDGKLAVSDNGQYLYVAYSNAAFVRRIDLGTMTAGPSFGVGSDMFGYALGVADMKVLPGQPLTVAMVRATAGSRSGLAVYNNGVKRPNEVGGAYSVLATGPSPSLVYALGDPGFTRLTVDGNGISFMDGLPFPGAGSPIKLEYDGTLCFVASGAVIDPIVPIMVGKFAPQAFAPLVAPDAARRRACFLSNLGTTYALQPHSLDTFTPLRALHIPKTYDWASSFIRCGSNTFAFCTRTFEKVVLVTSPLLGPAVAADISITQTSTPTSGIVGSNLAFSLVVSNAGPALATDVTLTNLLDNGVTFVSGSSSQGATPELADGRVVCNVGNLAAGASAAVNLVLRPTFGGWLTNHVSALANEADVNFSNNISLHTFFAAAPVSPNSVSRIRLATRDLAWSPPHSRFYASVSTNGLGISNVVVPIDPVTGAFDSPILSENDPGRLAVSDDGHRLFVGAGGDQAVWGLDLPDGGNASTFLVGTNPSPPTPYTMDDMEVLPGQSHALAISRRRTGGGLNAGIAIYDDGVMRPLTSPQVADTDVLEFGATAQALYAFNRSLTLSIGVRTFRRLDVSQQGVVLRDTMSGLITGTGEDFRYGAKRLFATGGSVIDPETRTKLGSVGTLQPRSLVEPDVIADRVFYFVPTANASQWSLLSFDLHTLAPWGSATISEVTGAPARLLRWGADGLAFRTSGDQIFIWRSGLVPTGPPVDLAVACTWSPVPVIVGSNVVLTISVTNIGPQTASNITASILLPESFVLSSVTSLQGTTGRSSLTAFCRTPSLAVGDGFSFQVQARASKVGSFRLFTGALSDGIDPNPDNHARELTMAVNVAGRINQPDEVQLTTRDLVFDSSAGRLMASVPAGAPAFEQSITSIDPMTGQAELVQRIQSGAERLALTDDGSRLYIGSPDSNSIVRLDLATRGVEPIVTLGTNSGQPLRVEDMETIPATSNALAVAVAGGAVRQVRIYDDATVRPGMLPDNWGARFLATGPTANVLYANSGQLRALNVNASGLESAWQLNLSLATSEDLEFDSGLIYSSAGKVVDPNARLLHLALGGLSSDALVKPVGAAGRVLYLNRLGTAWWLQAYDARTLAPVGSLRVTNVLGAPTRLLQWSANGVAFRTSSNQLFLLKTDLLPSAPPADLSLQAAAQTSPAVAGNPLSYSIQVTNAGPNTASNVLVTHRFPTNAAFVSASSSAGLCSRSNQIVRCEVGELATGATVQISIVLVPERGGDFPTTSSVISSALDPQPSNNYAQLRVPTLIRLPPNTSGLIELDAANLQYHAASGLLYASVSNGLSPWRDSIVTIDPRDGRIEKIFSAHLPSRMAFSDDGESLYVATDGDVRIRRFHLSGATNDLDFSVRDPVTESALLIRDLAVVPGSPSRLAVALGPDNKWASGYAVRMFDNGIQATNQGLGSEIEFVSDAVLFGYEYRIVPSQTYRMGILSTGLAISNTVGYLVAGHMKYDSGQIYTAGGQAIDPVTLSVTATFPVGGYAVEPRIAERRVYWLQRDNSIYVFHACDSTTQEEVGRLNLLAGADETDELLRCGYDFIAFRSLPGQVGLLRTSLVPPAAGADSDGDGMPDWWEVANGLDILSSADAATDADHDGMSNLGEFLAGTAPTNALSVLRLAPIASAGGVALTFQTTLGKSYRIERSDNLGSPSWESWADGIPGTGTNVLWAAPAPGLTNGFYRVRMMP